MRDGPRCKFTGILVFDMDKPFAAPGIGGIVVYVLAAVLTGYVLLVALSLMMAGGDGDAVTAPAWAGFDEGFAAYQRGD